MFKKDDEIVLIKTGQKDIITQVEVTSGGCYYYLKENGRVTEGDITDYLRLYQDEVYVLYNTRFNEYLAKTEYGYVIDELNNVARFKTKEDAEWELEEWVDYPEDFVIKKMKIRFEVSDIVE